MQSTPLEVKQVAVKELLTTIQQTKDKVAVACQKSIDYDVATAAGGFYLMDVPLFSDMSTLENIEELSMKDYLDMATSGMGIYVEEYADLLPESGSDQYRGLFGIDIRQHVANLFGRDLQPVEFPKDTTEHNEPSEMNQDTTEHNEPSELNDAGDDAAKQQESIPAKSSLDTLVVSSQDVLDVPSQDVLDVPSQEVCEVPSQEVCEVPSQVNDIYLH